ncbi:MAG TPA: cupin domain-containing protein [Candidatus Acidoferrales bacterium]|nr:cupin domain-containing protein [Candidatus Acidoferrales bacterium]
MITRRETLFAAFALVCQQAAAQDPKRPSQKSHSSASGLVFEHDLPNITMEDWQVTVSEVDFPPGRKGRVHHHAGFVLAFVLEGAILNNVSGQAERVYHKGEMFYEPPGSTHLVSDNASTTEPARLLAMIFAKKGATLTMPGPA